MASTTIAWLFPGQGSQSVGMGRDVFASSPAARAVLARVDAALGEPLSRRIAEGPEEALTLTANAQPAILATSCALLAALRERLPGLAAPLLAAGHSLGEYSALVAADALSLEDAVRLVRARGLAMQEAVPRGTGAMAAIVGVDAMRLAQLCGQARGDEVVTAANYNAPEQIVVAGHAGAVARLSAMVTAESGRAIALKVSAPFHCALMAPAARALEKALEHIPINGPRFPVVANFDARPNQESGRVKELLVRQVDGAVRWEETIRLMVGRGVTHAVEIGPGKVLAGLVKRITKEIRVLNVGDLDSLGEVTGFLSALDENAA